MANWVVVKVTAPTVNPIAVNPTALPAKEAPPVKGAAITPPTKAKAPTPIDTFFTFFLERIF